LLAEELKKPAAKRKSKKEWLAVHMGLYHDETARLCHWHIPQTHFLEQWSDALAFDGTASVVQPLIAPPYQGKSPHELRAARTRRKLDETSQIDSDNRPPLDTLRERWKSLDDTAWARAVHDGVLAGTAAKAVTPTLAADLFKKPEMKPVEASAKGYE